MTVVLPPRPARKLIEGAGLFQAVVPAALGQLDLVPLPDLDGGKRVWGLENPPLICTFCGHDLFARGLVDVNYQCGAGCTCPSGGCVPIR